MGVVGGLTVSSMQSSLARAYREETSALVAGRLPYALVLYLAAGTLLLAMEIEHRPERGQIMFVRWAVDVAMALVALAALRVARKRPPWPVWLVLTLLIVQSAASGVYNVVVGGQAERFVMVQVVLLNAAVVLFPWGWRPHAVLAAAYVIVFLAASPFLSAADALVFAAVVMIIGAIAAVVEAAFVQRHREDAFASEARAREEAQVADALYQASQTLGGLTASDDLLSAVSALAVDTVGTDWAITFVWDEDTAAFRLAGEAGLADTVRQEMASIDFTVAMVVAAGTLRDGKPVEVLDAWTDPRVPADLCRHWGLASLLAVPIARGTEAVGTLVVGYASPGGHFEPRQHRLVNGLAQVTAVTLDNVRLVADLRAADAFKSEFVSTMSHELRTPLNVILGFAEMARDEALDAASRRTSLDRVEMAGRELLTLIEDTLEMRRIEMGCDDVRLQRVELPNWWGELGATCERLPRREEVALEWQPDAPSLVLLTDPRKLSVVVRNLVGNACKFTEHGNVMVHADVRGGALVLRVSDTGIGIAAEEHDVIFDLFRQGDGSDSRRFGGVGLGLHIVKRFVDQLGGNVGLESRPGEGTTFTILVPVTLVQPRRDAA
jgi:signal transduction histidine kinase